jgi:hypothetical protein
LTRPPRPQPAAAVSPETELAATVAHLPRPQGVRLIAAMDIDNEMMVFLRMHEKIIQDACVHSELQNDLVEHLWVRR